MNGLGSMELPGSTSAHRAASQGRRLIQRTRPLWPRAIPSAARTQAVQPAGYPLTLIPIVLIAAILSHAPARPLASLATAAEFLLPRVCLAAEAGGKTTDPGAVLTTARPSSDQPPEGQRSLQELAQEAEQKCLDTALSPPTPEETVEVVEAACLLLQQKGTGALHHFRGGDSPFIFGGTYLWINDLDGIMIVHPIRPELEGLNVIQLRDTRGHRLFAEMNAAALDFGSAWVSYHWPRPGEKDSSAKRSYVMLCEFEGRAVVIGCGINVDDDGEEGTPPN